MDLYIIVRFAQKSSFFSSALPTPDHFRGLAAFAPEKAFAGVPDKTTHLFAAPYHPNRRGAEFIARQLPRCFAARDVARNEAAAR